MAHVLLGWEFGGNRGHATSLLAIAEALRKRGHRISFALQRVDALAPDQLHGAEVWPAPVTPRLLINTSRPNQGHPQTMGDIVARLGFDDTELVEALVRAWRQLLAAIRPDLVISDYGPFLLTAACGRVQHAAFIDGSLPRPWRRAAPLPRGRRSGDREYGPRAPGHPSAGALAPDLRSFA
jgi:hypothetical protein